MKKITIKAVKGESVIFCGMYAIDARGVKTECDSNVERWVCCPGGSHGGHHYDQRSAAELELKARIGELVLRGYKVEAVGEP